MAFVKNPKSPYPKGFKPRWREVLERKVAIYRRLPEDLTAELEALIPWFLDKVKWNAYGGIILHDEKNNKKLACQDWKKAKRLGSSDAEKYLTEFCVGY